MSGYTAADLLADRTIQGNSISMISIDIASAYSYKNDARERLFSSVGFLPNGFDIASIKIENTSTMDAFHYTIRPDFEDEDMSFCNALNLKAYDKDMGLLANGRLVDFYMDSRFIGSNVESIIFMLSFDDDKEALKNKTCDFNLIIKTYRKDPNETGGIYAQRIMGNTVTSGTW